MNVNVLVGSVVSNKHIGYIFTMGTTVPPAPIQSYAPIDPSVVSFTPVQVRLAARYSGSQVVDFSDFTPANSHYPIIASWNAIRITADSSDLLMVVTQGLAGRLDIISYNQYGRPDFWWAIAQANDHTNPFEQPQSGDQIRIPSLSRVLSILGQVGSGTEPSRYNP